MNRFDRLGSWFRPDGEPLGGDSEGDGEFFEYTLQLPHPPDQVTQSISVVQGKLVITYRFTFEDIELLETDDDE